MRETAKCVSSLFLRAPKSKTSVRGTANKSVMKPTIQTPGEFQHVDRFAAGGDESDVATISFVRPPSDRFPVRCRVRFRDAQSRGQSLVDAVPVDADRN